MPKDDPDGLTLLPDSITDDQGRTVSYTLNYMGQPLVIDSDQVYNNQGMRVSYLETTDLYDALAGQPGSPYTHGWLAETQTTWYNVSANTSHVLSSNAYTYDTAGLRLTNAVTNAAGSTRTETYTYDDLTRLSSVNYGDGGTQSYTFDAMGNRLSRQDSTNGTTNYAYNAANMLTSSTGTGASTYTNDADGDTLAGGGRGETWDSQNRMIGCSYGSSTDSFKYGADGLRRQMTSNGTVDNYAYDGQSMVREMNSALVSQATYLTGMRGPEYRRNDTQTESDGQGHTFGLTRWYVYDGLGSVVGEVDPLGNLTCADEYDVYGAVRGRTGTATTAHGFVGSLGHLSDASTGLIYMRARYYDPSTGRFASQDPALKGTNWYIYCQNNPTNLSDATGKNPFSIGIQDPDFLLDIYEAMEEGGTFADIMNNVFGGDVFFAAGTEGGIQNAIAIITFTIKTALQTGAGTGIEVDENGALGMWVADEIGCNRLGQAADSAVIENLETGEITDIAVD